MGQKYYEEIEPYTIERSTKETLVDYFIENNEDIEKKGTAQTPPKTQSKDVEALEEKNEWQIILEIDQQLRREQEAKENGNEKSKIERKSFKSTQK
ncbi:hypothetical protein JTB14_026006 [Gonioctena quinquepunctata]|nr:hypothetical protein JTB14_026006 [Gonioctena quinquepunctata]